MSSHQQIYNNSVIEDEVTIGDKSQSAALVPGVVEPVPSATLDSVVIEANSEVQELAVILQAIPRLPLDQNPAAIYLASLRPVGRRGMLRALAAIVETIRGEAGDPLDFPWHTLRFQHTQALRAKLAERYRPATVNHMLSALRGVLSQAENLGLISADDFRRTTKLKGIRSETLQKGRALDGNEIKLLLKTCQKDVTLRGTRDVALVAVLYGAGLRRSEMVKLDLKDFEPKENALKIRSGKGGKDRLTYLGQGAGTVLARWVKARGEEAGTLFLPINKAEKLMNRRLSDQAILWVLEQRGKEAGLEHFSPHDMRRTFISDLLDAGADIATVQKLAGHASVTTTARYDRRGEVTKQKAAELLNTPFGQLDSSKITSSSSSSEADPVLPVIESEASPNPTETRSLPKRDTAPVPLKTLKVALWLRVENNSKFVRGKTKARLWIEQSILGHYGMEKPYADRGEYILTIPYRTEEELDKIIDDILREADSIADMQHCFIEADVQALDGSERNW